MEFGIGFVLGGVATGVTVANWGFVVKSVQLGAGKLQTAIEGKSAATKLK